MLPLQCLGGYRPHLSVVVASVKMDLCTALPMSAQSHGQTIFFTPPSLSPSARAHKSKAFWRVLIGPPFQGKNPSRVHVNATW